MDNHKLIIGVATHKAYDFPTDDAYLPLHVGKNLNPIKLKGTTGDDTGDNISSLNPYFCELTGQYWLWKNIDADYYGLVHYRRYFGPIDQNYHWLNNKKITTSASLLHALYRYEIILAKPRHYWIETVETHYAHAHYAEDLHKLKDILEKHYPDYLDAYHTVLTSKSLSLYNMFVMRKELFHAYNSWLFSILFALEPHIPYSTYGAYQKRVFGFLGERLLNIWVYKNIPHQNILYIPITNLEKDNFWVKLKGFLFRKFFGYKKN